MATKRKTGGAQASAKPARSAASSKWSGAVTRDSHALALEANVFTCKDPRRIARSLKRSAEASADRKSSPFRSAMSMLTFYINRAGRDLPGERREVLEKAKSELRKVFGRSSP